VFDLHLKAGSPAIGAGTTTDAPATDVTGAARVPPIDAGAYVYAPASGEGRDTVPPSVPTDLIGTAVPSGLANSPAPAANPAASNSASLPQIGTGAGLNAVDPHGGTTRTVKAAPCGTAARETDGTTTCVGIPDPKDQSPRKRRR